MDNTSFQNESQFQNKYEDNSDLEQPNNEISSNYLKKSTNDNNEEVNNDKQTNDQIFNMMKEFLPDIENELRKELTLEFEAEYQKKYNDLIIETKQEAKNEIDSIIEEIKNESLRSYNEKIKILQEKEADLIALKDDYKKIIEIEIAEKLTKEFELEKEKIIQSLMEQFNNKKLSEDYKQKLNEKLKIEYDQELKKEILRKEKLMKLNFKKKLEVEKKLIQETYELEWRTKIENGYKQLEKEKNEIGRLKSLENLRMKKIEEEKKEMKKEIDQLEKKYESTISELQNKVSELTATMLSNETNTIENEKKFITYSDFNKKEFKTQDFKDKSDTKSNKITKQDEEFQTKYLKAINNSPPPKKFEEKTKNFLSEENWISIEKLINPQSPPKLLHLSENDFRTLNEESYENKQQIVTKNHDKTIKGKENKPTRILIGEYNSKQIAEEIIKSYTNNKSPTKTNLIKVFNDTNQLKNIDPNIDINSETNRAVKSSEKINHKEFEKNDNLEKVKFNKFEKKEDSNRYKEIIKKYVHKYNNEDKKPKKNAFSNEQSENIFQENSNDNPQIKKIKKLRKEIILKIERDFGLEEKYQAMEIYLKNDFLNRIRCTDISLYSKIKENIDSLTNLWVINDIGFKERISFISCLDNMTDDGTNLNKKLEFEIEFLQNNYRNYSEIIEKLIERNKFKSRINYNDFSFISFKKIYLAIEKINDHISILLNKLENENESGFFWRGIDIRNIIYCDSWEKTFIEKEEMKTDILNKIKKKML